MTNQSVDWRFKLLADRQNDNRHRWVWHTNGEYTRTYNHTNTFHSSRISAPIDFNWIELSIRPHDSSTLFLFYSFICLFHLCFLQLLWPYTSLYDAIRFRMHSILLSSAWYMTIRTFLDGPTSFDCLFIVATTPRNTRPHSECVSRFRNAPSYFTKTHFIIGCRLALALIAIRLSIYFPFEKKRI